jgi:hypothetical protein
MLNAVFQQEFSKSVSTLPRFLHRETADNMEPLTGGEVSMIRWGDRWLLILMRKYLKKIPAEVSKKLDFGH